MRKLTALNYLYSRRKPDAKVYRDTVNEFLIKNVSALAKIVSLPISNTALVTVYIYINDYKKKRVAAFLLMFCEREFSANPF